MRHLINIPEEMRSLDQWCIASPDKVPYIIRGNELIKARVNKGPWLSFEKAVSVAELYGTGIGFVLTSNDPFVCIDLDIKDAESINISDRSKLTRIEDLNRYERIVTAFNSYSELSASGKGVHIWTKGYSGAGCRRDGVEVYSQDRFIICTGKYVDSIKYEIHSNVVKAYPLITLPKRIEDRADLLKMLVAEMGGASQSDDILVEVPEERSDDEIVEMACLADNGEKFTALCNGEWEQYGYPSQSEADLSLMAMLAFYSPSNEQCRRIFRMTKLGKRDKAIKNDRYLNYTLRAIRSKQSLDNAISIDLEIKASKLLAEVRKENAGVRVENQVSFDINADIDFPPGVAGELARFIYMSSVRPVKEVAIVAAIGFLAGVCGKAFHIPQSGLNMYIILIARSAIGKEAMHSGISFLLNKLRSAIPRVSEFVTFNDFASGPSLQKACAVNQSFVSVAGEWGRKLKRLAMEDGGDGPMQQLRTVMTNLYQKSGPASIVGGISYSSKDQNVDSVSGVAYSMIGETTPGTFYESLTESMMEDGFLSRFVVVEYSGERPAANKHPVLVPSEDLTNQLCYIVEHSLNLLSRGQYVQVAYDDYVRSALDAYDRECDIRINSSDDEGWRQMWNRAHLKVCRLAALIAVADNPANPVVSKHHLDWALTVINKNIAILSNKMETGDIGSNDLTRERKMVHIINEYLLLTEPSLKAYQVDPVLRDNAIIPRKYLQVRAQRYSCFYKTRNGSNQSFELTLRYMIDNGFIVEMDKKEMIVKYGSHGKCYKVVDLPKYL